MDLDQDSLRLMDTQDFTILNSQPIQSIRVWGVGRDNGRYVWKQKKRSNYVIFVLLYILKNLF